MLRNNSQEVISCPCSRGSFGSVQQTWCAWHHNRIFSHFLHSCVLASWLNICSFPQPFKKKRICKKNKNITVTKRSKVSPWPCGQGMTHLLQVRHSARSAVQIGHLRVFFPWAKFFITPQIFTTSRQASISCTNPHLLMRIFSVLFSFV